MEVWCEGKKKEYMNNYGSEGSRNRAITEDGEEVDSIMGKKKQIWMERQEVPTETDMSHTSEPDTRRGNITFLSLFHNIFFSLSLLVVFYLPFSAEWIVHSNWHSNYYFWVLLNIPTFEMLPFNNAWLYASLTFWFPCHYVHFNSLSLWRLNLLFIVVALCWMLHVQSPTHIYLHAEANKHIWVLAHRAFGLGITCLPN